MVTAQGHRAGGWDTNGRFCGWLLGQRLRGEIRYSLLIDSAQNPTDKMFPKFSWASRGRVGQPAPLSPPTMVHWTYLHLRTQLGPVWPAWATILSAKSSG